MQVVVERIFTNSVHLSTEAVQAFVAQLCAVSKQELMSGHSRAAGESKPRIFCLQKVIDWLIE